MVYGFGSTNVRHLSVDLWLCNMAINGLLEQMCEEEGVGFVDLWGYFVGKEDMFMRDGLHLSGKGAAVFYENLLRSMDNGTGCNFLN